MLAQPLTKEEIFHQSQGRKAALAHEKIAFQKQSLIAIDDTRQTNAGRGANVNGAIQPAMGTHPHREAAGHDTWPSEKAFGILERSSLQRAVGMEKQQNITGSLGCA